MLKQDLNTQLVSLYKHPNCSFITLLVISKEGQLYTETTLLPKPLFNSPIGTEIIDVKFIGYDKDNLIVLYIQDDGQVFKGSIQNPIYRIVKEEDNSLSFIKTILRWFGVK